MLLAAAVAAFSLNMKPAGSLKLTNKPAGTIGWFSDEHHAGSPRPVYFTFYGITGSSYQSILLSDQVICRINCTQNTQSNELGNAVL